MYCIYQMHTFSIKAYVCYTFFSEYDKSNSGDNWIVRKKYYKMLTLSCNTDTYSIVTNMKMIYAQDILIQIPRNKTNQS